MKYSFSSSSCFSFISMNKTFFLFCFLAEDIELCKLYISKMTHENIFSFDFSLVSVLFKGNMPFFFYWTKLYQKHQIICLKIKIEIYYQIWHIWGCYRDKALKSAFTSFKMLNSACDAFKSLFKMDLFSIFLHMPQNSNL